MYTLEATLRAYDPVMLSVIAARWDVDLESYSVTDITALLIQAMLNPDNAAATWDRLDDDQRGAMQTLLGAGGTMAAHLFGRMFGEIREMGPGRLEREKPYLEPANVAETLFYRGLIARGFDEATAGPQAVIYVPDDLAAVLPAHVTGFDLSADDGDEDFLPEVDADEDWIVAADEPEELFSADTSLVDDLTTLLAYVQVAAVAEKDDGTLPEAHVETLRPFLLKSDPERLRFMLGLARALGLLAPREGLLRPVSQSARRWLEAPRSEQVRLLAVGWRESAAYNELLHTPGIIVEQADNDPRLARQIVFDSLAALTADTDSWWIVDAVIEEIRQVEPDFQRPGGDYESWYIRDADSHTYINGFESWPAVEGAMLGFILTGPLHWLGLADLGRYSGRTLGRLNAYGRAFVSGREWPAPSEGEASVTLQEDGTALATRRLSRYDRFQLARFTEWLNVGDAYRYKISPRGLRRAAIQNITIAHIRAFLERTVKAEALPASVETLLARWGQTADADATIEALTVLRMATAAALDAALADPAIRRYLGARLGPEAVIVRPGQAAELQDALAAQGILAALPEDE
ncbi:MAG: helicase-associated domain-containing protein [Anaerolineae bacterium]|nr:helicase-associated domain-containing protein [Anaerolineae bacterium]